MKTFKKRLLLALGAVLVLIMIILGCTKPDFRTFSNPMMTTGDMEVELARLHEINLTADSGNFDTSIYPLYVGVDARNGRMLVEKFICWDKCPDVGMVFLLYQNVETPEACVQAVVGTPLFSPAPISGRYWGCRPVVDWLNLPGTTPG